MSKGQNQLFEAALAARKAALAGPKVIRPIDDDLAVELPTPIIVEPESLAGPITEKNSTPLPKPPRRVAPPVLPDAPIHQGVDKHIEPTLSERRLPSAIDLSKTELPALLHTMFKKVHIGQDRIIVDGMIGKHCNPSLEPINRCIERMAREKGISIDVVLGSREGRFRIFAK
jgi:hypothetical protein